MKFSSSSSLAKSMFSIGTADTVMDGSNGSSSSISPARLGPSRQGSPLEVDEEYSHAFKSRSFLDLWSHAHHSLRDTFKLSFKPSASSFNDGDSGAAAMDEPSCSYTVLDDFVLEPRQEALASAGRRRRQRWRLCRHSRRRVEVLLLEYFDVTREACVACSALLAAAGAARRHHLVLRRLLYRLDVDSGDHAAAARDALERHVRLDNPLSPAGGRLAGFNSAHARCAPLSRRLGEARRRLRRLARLTRFARCTAATALVGASAAAVVAAVVLAAHVVVGVDEAAAVTFCATSSTRPSPRRASNHKKLALRCHDGRRRRYTRAGQEAAVNAAAPGRVHCWAGPGHGEPDGAARADELEHGRDMARIAVAAGQGGEQPPLLQEVTREEEECGEDLRCQLEELEEHACLCLLATVLHLVCLFLIQRLSRNVTAGRMVAHEITSRDGSPSTDFFG